MARRDGVADAEPWTREQIEAWVTDQPPGRIGRQIRLAREVLVRRFPEAPDYDVLVEKIARLVRDESEVTVRWRETATDAEIVAHAERTCAALWSRSLSEPSDGDAP